MREMKDSGVEWIGKIPKDWEIVPLTKQLDSIVDYRGKTPEKTEEGTFLVTAKNIKDGKICYELSKEYVREADYEEIMHRGIPQIGDILFTTEAPLGQVANVDRTDIALAQRIIKFRALSTVNNYYLKYWMLNEGLCRVKRQAVISEDNENAGKYKIEVEFSGIESDSEVTVSPFNSKQEQTLSEHIEFSELEILQLSEFYEITARSGDDTIRRIIMIPTSGFPDDRESAAVNSVVKDRASFVEYIAFVLGDDYVASMLEGKQMGESGFFANSSDAMPALYEKMLKTSVEGPERIKDIGYVLKMVTDKDIIPDEFRELYETFCNTLKIRR